MIFMKSTAVNALVKPHTTYLIFQRHDNVIIPQLIGAHMKMVSLSQPPHCHPFISSLVPSFGAELVY